MSNPAEPTARMNLRVLSNPPEGPHWFGVPPGKLPQNAASMPAAKAAGRDVRGFE